MHFLAHTVLALAASSLSSAHLIMNSPVPFGRSTLTNSPLNDAAIGSAQSDYPCKQRPGVYDIGTMNMMSVGAPQRLSFEGSASHGGGTCQIVVSLDAEPTVSSVFKIIQVFEGGCPINSDGNTGTKDFTFSIPAGFPNGRATMAWVWNNRIGNREFYMNCAPITVSGGASNQAAGMAFYNSLPNLYIVNQPTSQCRVDDGAAVQIPYPGNYVVRDPTNQRISPAVGPGCAAAAAAQLAGVGAAPSVAPTTTTTVARTTTTTTTTARTTTTTARTTTTTSRATTTTRLLTTTRFTQIPVELPTSTRSTTRAATTTARSTTRPTTTRTTTRSATFATSTRTTSRASSVPTASPSTPPTGRCATGTYPCNTFNEFFCVTENMFAICDSNLCGLGRNVAPGTACRDGGITWA